MQSIAVGALSLIECVSCDGLWVDAEAFERICADHEAQAAVLHRSAIRAPALEKRVTYRPCVRCGTMMNRVNFAQLSGTIVDVCRGHGTFLDAGELNAIVRFIQGGGLDRARQRQVEDLKEREKRLRDQETRLAASGRGSSVYPRVLGTELSFQALIELLRDN
jgi:Zn-finger nucleic acid-binding protein